MAARKIVKPQGQTPDEFEEQVASVCRIGFGPDFSGWGICLRNAICVGSGLGRVSSV